MQNNISQVFLCGNGLYIIGVSRINSEQKIVRSVYDYAASSVVPIILLMNLPQLSY